MQIALQSKDGRRVYVRSAPLRRPAQAPGGDAGTLACPHVEVTQDWMQLASRPTPIAVLASVLASGSSALGLVVASAAYSVQAWLFDLGQEQVKQWLRHSPGNRVVVVFQSGGNSSTALLASDVDPRDIADCGENLLPVTTDRLFDATHRTAEWLEDFERAIGGPSRHDPRRDICIHLVTPASLSNPPGW